MPQRSASTHEPLSGRPSGAGATLTDLIRQEAIKGIKKGDLITDGMVVGQVTGEGTFGPKNLPAWQIQIEGGTRPGQTSLILKGSVKDVFLDLQDLAKVEARLFASAVVGEAPVAPASPDASGLSAFSES